MKLIYTLTFKDELTVQIKNYVYIANTLFSIHWHVRTSNYWLLISHFNLSSVLVYFNRIGLFVFVFYFILFFCII
jgi:hypothetical protein